jgi:hypothetical protein
MGWAELENGQLLAAAENAGFALMVTGDKNISYQQNLNVRQIALIVLSTNNWNVVKHRTASIVEAVGEMQPGSFLFLQL